MSKNGRTDISEATPESCEFRESLQFDLTSFILVAFFFFFKCVCVLINLPEDNLRVSEFLLQYLVGLLPGHGTVKNLQASYLPGWEGVLCSG